MSRLGVVAQSSYKYYKIPINCLDSAQTLTLKLVALSGNPDLLLSTQTQKPTLTDFTLASTLNGSDELQIESPVSGVYYIGVHGQTSASFKLQAVMDMYTGKHMCRTFRLEDVVLVEGEESERVILDSDFVVSGNASFDDSISVAGAAFIGDSMHDTLYLRSNTVVGTISNLTSVIQRQTVQNIRAGDLALIGAETQNLSSGVFIMSKNMLTLKKSAL